MEKHPIKASSMHEVDHYGIGKLALDHVNLQRDCPIHLSFDVDALDPSVASCTGTPPCDLSALSDLVLEKRPLLVEDARMTTKLFIIPCASRP